MKKILLVAAMIAGTASMASAGGSKHHGGYAYGSYTIQGVTIVVSCYRGPWREVIWDRPNGVFYDSLINAGYSPANAQAVAERICRDQRLVGNLQNMIDEVRSIVRASPRR